MDTLKIGTVFSGIGAFEQALQILNLPHKIEFACDNGNIEFEKIATDQELRRCNEITDLNEKLKFVESVYKNKKRKKNYVKESYLNNYELDDENFYHDIRFLGSHINKQIDVFVGGSPCQSFSVAGKRGGLEDTRGTLFFEFARCVKEFQPKVFIYENVKGLLSHDKGKTWEVMKNVFDDLGYSYKYQVLNAKDYGIPQNRQRIFVIGFRQDLKNVDSFSFPKKIELDKKVKDLLETKIDDKYFLSKGMAEFVVRPHAFNVKPTTDTDIAKTLTATMVKMHRASCDNYVTTNGRLRKLTPRECLRLMGFSDNFKQVVSDVQMYKQCGNSIVVNVLIEIFKEILNTGIFE